MYSCNHLKEKQITSKLSSVAKPPKLLIFVDNFQLVGFSVVDEGLSGQSRLGVEGREVFEVDRLPAGVLTPSSVLAKDKQWMKLKLKRGAHGTMGSILALHPAGSQEFSEE